MTRIQLTHVWIFVLLDGHWGPDLPTGRFLAHLVYRVLHTGADSPPTENENENLNSSVCLLHPAVLHGMNSVTCADTGQLRCVIPAETSASTPDPFMEEDYLMHLFILL